MKKESAVLLFSCPDREGIVAKVSDFIFRRGGNIEHADQHIDVQSATLFMRIQWAMDDFSMSRTETYAEIQNLARDFGMEWSLYFTKDTPSVALFVSRYMHCLYDVLLRYKEGQYNCRIPLIISNHPDAENVADHFGIEFKEYYVCAENKAHQEEQQLRILEEYGVDTIVFARYMQVVSSSFVDRYRNRIINVHHSFLPAFSGSNPYLQAFDKGVKIIGATSHYVNSELDSGPIIDQDTVRISHRDSLTDLVNKGQDLEKMVLNRALKWHLEHKILVYNNKTVVFD